MSIDRVVTVGSLAVALTEHGDPAGAAVFLFHGTPASRIGWEFVDGPARERGLRILCPDRPGIGGSTPHPDRTLRGYADETLALADAMDVDDFAVLAHSGGGPYALACAAGCGPRVRSAAIMAGVAPVDDRIGALAGLSASDVQFLDLSVRAPERAARILAAQRLAVRVAPWAAVRQLSAEVSAPDRLDLASVPPRVAMAQFVEALRQGPAGVVLDYRLWASPWELDWAAVAVPVHVVQGDDDRIVPVEHARDILARLPAGIATLHLLPGVGHLSIRSHIGAVLDLLTLRTRN